MSKVGKASIRFALLCSALLLGCGAPETAGETAISRERFVDAQVALRQIDRRTPEADSLRAEVMTTLRITEEDLTKFVDARADRPAELASVYEEIRQRLREIREEQRQPRADPDADASEEDVDDEEVATEREAQRLRIRAPGAPPPVHRI